MEIEIIVDDGAWNSGLGDDVVRPTARKAIDLYADRVIADGRLEVEIDNHKVRMIKNEVLEKELFKMMKPETGKAKYMINVEVGILTEGGTRWFVGIYYKLEDDKWVEEDDLKQLNSYETVKSLDRIGGESTVIGQYRPVEIDLNDSKRLLLEKGAELEKPVKCPLCKTEELTQDAKFAPPGIYWYCPRCHGFWNNSYLNGFWTGYIEAHKEARKIVDEFDPLAPLTSELHDALEKHDEEYGNCTISRYNNSTF